MAGPLPTDLRLALFQILELPMYPKQATVYPDGSVARVHDLTNQQWEIGGLIDGHLNQFIYPDSVAYTALTTLLTAWQALGTNNITLQQGAVGNISGIDTSTDAQRAEIRKQVIVLVPYYRHYDEMLRRRSATIEIIR